LIAAITPTAAAPDVSLVPGFVDVQVNGIDDTDVFRAVGDDWDRLSDLLLDQGVTSWCPTLVSNTLDRYAAPLERMAAARSRAAHGGQANIIGAHLEGPFLGGAPGAHPRHLLAAVDLDWLGRLPEVVRLVTLAPELDHAVDAVRLLRDRGCVVALGHSTPSLEHIALAVDAGASMATHLFNGMSGVHHRQPGLAAAALVDDRLSAGIIGDLIHVHPLALQLAFRAKPAGSIVLVTDSVAWRSGGVGEIVLERRDGAARLPDGTLAGSVATMDQMIRNLVDACAIPLEHALAAASTNPARLMGCVDRDVIAIGRRADLVALDPTMHIAGVWVGGACVRTSAFLR
jgi:N-acetylglucosamine-6-phosphate deacetylase